MASTSAPNIWETLLKESSKRVELPHGSVLFFGNASCGKTALVGKMCEDSDGPSKEEVPKIPDITAYDSFIANDVDEVLSSHRFLGIYAMLYSNELFARDRLSRIISQQVEWESGL